MGEKMKHNFWLILCFFACFLFGCQDSTFYKVDERKPSILVIPEAINFGHIESGKETGGDYFSIINVGDETLTIDSILLDIGSENFEIETGEVSEIEPGQSVSFDVYYDPKTYERNFDRILITSDDETQIESYVNLAGFGDAPVINVSPETINYGEISIGCDVEERITIRNEGNLNLTVDSLLHLVNQPSEIYMEFGSLPEPPWEIESDKELDFLVSYIPEDVGYDESQVTISSNDPINPEIVASQSGAAEYLQEYTDTWEQEAVPVIDLLWVIDNSGSMQIFQNSMSANSAAFINAFLTSNADYHIAVITTDDPSFSVIVDNSTLDPAGTLSTLFLVGNSGSGMEKGIDMSYKSLSDPMYAGPGGNFFREAASLVVVYVSDEPDQSGFWMSYVPFFESIKPEGLFIPYGVIGDTPGGCEYVYSPTGYTRTVPRSAGYHELIAHFGGDWFSICAEDWGDQMEELSENVINRSSFQLSKENLIEDTIRVYVNGQLLEDGWSYSSDTNTITFDSESVPESGQTIEISYAVWGCGDE